MSKHIHPKVKKHYKRRFGSAVEHGIAHSKEHHRWNRRDFIRMTGLMGLGGSLLLGKTPVSAMAASPLLAGLNAAECGDRILVLIRLKGGNDGLNTIIHRGSDEYYNIRPTLAVQEADLWGLNADYGMPNVMQSLQPFWEEGRMQVIHNVGYPDANYSHFRSSDIWASASDSDEHVSTGWIGRWLDNEFPAFVNTPPVIPPALQIGVQTNLLFRAAAGPMALSISNPTEFYQIAQSGELYDTTQLDIGEPKGAELSYVRSIANSAFRYSETIRDAYNGSTTQANYDNNYLAREMSIVARLIKGNLGTKVYMVSIGGFDTHADQNPSHLTLINRVATSVSSFFEDLAASGHHENVLAMTFSEFGRTIFENGSLGTDHGTGAPMLLFGEGIGQGLHGEAPNLVDVDMYGDPEFSIDFRQAYATVLQNWMCVAPELVQHALGNTSFPIIDGLLPPSNPPIGTNGRAALLGHNPHPSQANSFQIKYALKTRGNVRIQITNAGGQVLRTLHNEFMEKGSYTLSFNPIMLFLSSGNYFYKLEAGGQIFTQPISW